MPVWVIVAVGVVLALAAVLVGIMVLAGRADRALEEQRARRALQRRQPGEWEWPDHG